MCVYTFVSLREKRDSCGVMVFNRDEVEVVVECDWLPDERAGKIPNLGEAPKNAEQTTRGSNSHLDVKRMESLWWVVSSCNRSFPLISLSV